LLSYTVQNHCFEKNRKAGLTLCLIDFVSPKTPPFSPLSIGNETPTVRHTSKRLACAQKRSYVNIQITNARTGRFKKPKPLDLKLKVSSPTTSKLILSRSTIKDSVSSKCAIKDFLSTKSTIFPFTEPKALEALVDNAYC